jgi:hypothetical protein
MSPFELVFAVFGLLLGLAIAEVLGGFSRALKLKRGARPVRIGWLTPLLGLFVIADLTSFWLDAYDARDWLQANYLTLLAVLVIVGIYYLAASLIFPEDPEAWPDFDDHYDRQNRMVLGGMLAANVGSWIAQIALLSFGTPPTPTAEQVAAAQAAEAAAEAAGTPIGEYVTYGAGLGVLALLIALLIVGSRRWNVALLATGTILLVVNGIAEMTY